MKENHLIFVCFKDIFSLFYEISLVCSASLALGEVSQYSIRRYPGHYEAAQIAFNYTAFYYRHTLCFCIMSLLFIIPFTLLSTLQFHNLYSLHNSNNHLHHQKKYSRLPLLSYLLGNRHQLQLYHHFTYCSN